MCFLIITGCQRIVFLHFFLLSFLLHDNSCVLVIKLDYITKLFHSMPGNELTEHMQALHVHKDKERRREMGRLRKISGTCSPWSSKINELSPPRKDVQRDIVTVPGKRILHGSE